MTDPPPTITCGIVAYRRPGLVHDALARLVGSGVEVVVVNVGRDEGVAEVVRSAPVPACLVEIDNRGYAAAVNVIARAARGDVVVFANDDARITGGDVARLAAVVARGDADVAVPRVVDGDSCLERTIAAIPDPASLAREWLLLPDQPVKRLDGRMRVHKWRAPERPERIEAAAAVVVAVRRDLLLELPLPEEYFLYWEESEWFWRLRARGAVVQYRPEITCEHDGGRGDVRPEKSRLLARNAVRCVRRTQGRAAALAAVIVVIAWNLRLVMVDGCRVITRPSARRRRRLRARWAGLAAALTSWGEVL